jgi:predicted transcriptional regulator
VSASQELPESVRARIPEVLARHGGNKTAAARELGIRRGTVKKWAEMMAPAEAMLRTEEMLRIPPQAVAEMRQAAEESESWEEPIEQVWRREEERSTRAIRKAKGESLFRWTSPHKNLLLAFLSDHHIAPGTPCDFKRMREDAELIRDTPGCYAVLAGDQVDNHIKHRAAVLGSRSTPEDQYRLFEYYLGILGPKCLVVTSGNHDDWTKQYAGVDVLGRIVRDNRVFFSPDEAWLEIAVGGQNYVVGVRHQYRFGSQFNQTHTVKQWLRLGPREFDVGVIGHHHEAAVEQTLYRGRLRWMCRPGSYQITSSYSRQYGFNQSVPTCPTFLFHGDKWGIAGYESLRAMVDAHRAVRELGAA